MWQVARDVSGQTVVTSGWAIIEIGLVKAINSFSSLIGHLKVFFNYDPVASNARQTQFSASWWRNRTQRDRETGSTRLVPRRAFGINRYICILLFNISLWYPRLEPPLHPTTRWAFHGRGTAVCCLSLIYSLLRVAHYFKHMEPTVW